MRRVLLIALEFAPVQTTGAFRSIDLARRLPEFGYSPHVLTLEPGEGSRIFAAPRNPTLLSGLEGIAIDHLTPRRPAKLDSGMRQLLRLLTTFNDTFFKRYEQPLMEKLTGLQDSEFCAVVASAPPFGAADLGRVAARRLGVPLVLDMRDAWADWGMAPYPTRLHYLARRRDEIRAFGAADAIVTVTPQLADLFRRQHPEIPADRVHVIPNGFEGALFEPRTLQPPRDGETFDIAYVGSFYYTPPKPPSLRRPHSLLQYDAGHEDWSYRSPLYFFRAWKQLFATDPDVAGRVRFHHFGAAPAWLMEMARAHGVGDLVKLWGMLPKQDLGPALEAMDAQLCTSMKREDGGDYCLASKTFDYLIAGKPILALVTPGAQRDFLTEAGVALIADPDDEAAGASALRTLALGQASLRLNAAYVNRFHRRENAQALAAVLEAATPSHTQRRSRAAA